jgi:hypothetical protein
MQTYHYQLWTVHLFLENVLKIQPLWYWHVDNTGRLFCHYGIHSNKVIMSSHSKVTQYSSLTDNNLDQ